MPFSLEQFRKEVRREFLDTCTVEERLQGLAVEGRFRGLAVEDRFRGLAVEDLQKLPAQLNQQLLELLQAANARSGTP